MRWYADNSELNGIKEAEIPDILLFGGVVISADAEKHLQAKVEKIKAQYGHQHAPLKWNMKDLKELYRKQKQESLYSKLLSESREWRTNIFNCLAAVDCTLIVACIEGYSSKRDVLIRRKEDLCRFIFSNGLMRYGLHVREKKPRTAQVILDWPDKGHSKPFDTEYAHAYSLGKTSDGNVPYRCGKLKALGFVDSVLFTSMAHCTMLQMADLVTGATREFIECSLEKKCGGQGLDCLKIVREKIRGAPDKIVGWGLIVPSGNDQFLSKIKIGVKELLYGPA